MDGEDRRLVGKVAVVTGASLGVGRAAALALARAGADLVLCARGREITAVAREARALGARVLARRCDVSDRYNFLQAVSREKPAKRERNRGLRLGGMSSWSGLPRAYRPTLPS